MPPMPGLMHLLVNKEVISSCEHSESHWEEMFQLEVHSDYWKLQKF